MSNILIEANSISKVYDQDIYLKRGMNYYALSNVDLIVEEGDFIAVMGPSGSGKSTLLNCISSLDKVTSGNISILGQPISTMKDNDLSDFRKNCLGFIFQNHNLVSSLSVFDNIATPLILAKNDTKDTYQRISEIADILKIKHILHKKPDECSGGEKQRAAIARAIVTRPKLIVCDEPTGNLDSENSHEVLTLLSKLNQKGIAIILVTHDSMIASYAKKFMYLRDGQVKTVINRNNASQEEFYNAIVKITTQDTLLKKFMIKDHGGEKNE